jgi:hypothetical protein
VRERARYAASFYAAAGAAPATVTCAAAAACSPTVRQILARLIEETAIEGFAMRNGIRLRSADRAAISEQLAQLASTPPINRLLSTSKAYRALLATILNREVLVQQVERRVTEGVPRRGPSDHLRFFTLPSGGNPQASYRSAAQLAADGPPAPAGTTVRDEWIAIFRLPAYLRTALAQATPGQYVGPFLHRDSYRVVLLEGSGVHQYGAPAEASLRQSRFAAWLRHLVRTARPACFSPTGAAQRCPLGYDEERVNGA